MGEGVSGGESFVLLSEILSRTFNLFLLKLIGVNFRPLVVDTKFNLPNALRLSKILPRIKV